MNIRKALAQALAQGGIKDEAISVLTSQESPDRYSRKEALLMLGAYYAENGMIPQAEIIYKQLGQSDPDNTDVLINLAAAALYKEDFDAMKRSLDKVLEINPESVKAMINMGNYYAKRNQPGEAQKWFERAVQAEPQNYLAQIGLGVQTIRAGNLKEGIEHIIKAVLLKPDFAEGYQILATIYSELGKEEQARKYADLRDLFQQ
jgi:tetratricopeptide (TPR) repeat protein